MTDQAESSVSAHPADDNLAKAAAIISSNTRWAAACGILPVPLLDVVALAAVQTSMVSQISNVYGETLSQAAARSLVSVMLGTLLPSSAAGAVSSGIKTLPVVGYLVGAVSMAGLGAAATYAVGKVFVRHFEKGGKLSDFLPERIQDELRAEFASAKSKRKTAAEPATAS